MAMVYPMRRPRASPLVTAPIVQSATERLQAAADQLGLTAEQGRRIVDTHKSADGKYGKLADDRREVIQSEPRAVDEILAPRECKPVSCPRVWR